MTAYYVALALAVIVTLISPRRYAPSALFLIWAIVPVAYLQNANLVYVRYFHPSVVGLILWMFLVKGIRVKSTVWVGGLWVAFAALITWSTISSVQPSRSLIWLLTVFPIIFLLTNGNDVRISASRGPLLLVVRCVTIALGIFAVLERAQHANPLAQFYFINGSVIGQRWSIYRVETTLGHPLMNALFFCVVTVFFLLRWLERREFVDLVAGCVAGGALWLTGSRGGILAASVALLLALAVFGARRSTNPGARYLIAAGVVALFALISVYGIPSVRDSEESRVSSSYREQGVEVANRAIAQNPWFGSGPGTSQRLLDELRLDATLESSALQLAVSLGVAGAILFLFLTLAGVRSVWRRGSLSCAAAIVAFWVEASTFNLIDTIPAALFLVAAMRIVGAISLEEAGRTPGEVARQLGIQNPPRYPAISSMSEKGV